LVETVDVLMYLDGSWRELPYPYFLDLVFQAKAILSSMLIIFSSELDLVKPGCEVSDLKCSVLSLSLSSF
jgi:hypothetical protein